MSLFYFSFMFGKNIEFFNTLNKNCLKINWIFFLKLNYKINKDVFSSLVNQPTRSIVHYVNFSLMLWCFQENENEKEKSCLNNWRVKIEKLRKHCKEKVGWDCAQSKNREISIMQNLLLLLNALK